VNNHDTDYEQCIRGCTIRRKHLKDCPASDHSDGAFVAYSADEATLDGLCSGDHPRGRDKVWIGRYGGLETWHSCYGCKPRVARHGLLCPSCHLRLEEWVSGDHGLAWVYDWLGENLSRGGTSAARQDWQRPTGKEGAPLPIRESIHDHRVLLSDRVYIAEERTRQVFNRPAAEGAFDLAVALKFLSSWQVKIETEAELVVWMWDKFEETMRDAASIAPWRDAPRRILGVACPECELEALAVYSGDENVTCRNCRLVIPKERYEIWVRILAYEAQHGTDKESA
jgi:hypothetical protein